MALVDRFGRQFATLRIAENAQKTQFWRFWGEIALSEALLLQLRG